MTIVFISYNILIKLKLYTSMTVQKWLDKWVQAPVIILEELEKKSEVLESFWIEITQNLVSAILWMVDIEDAEAVNCRRLIERQILAYICGFQSTVITLETKDDFLKELDSLMLKPTELSQRKVDNFREALFGEQTSTEIAKLLKWWNKIFNDFFKDHNWIEWMRENLYDLLKNYINSNFG